MDYQSKCMKISTPTNNPVHTNSGGKKLFNSKRPSYTSERDLTVGAPHLHPHQDPYSTISGGELPEIQTPWTPLKDVSDHAWLTQNKYWRTSGIDCPHHGRKEEQEE